MSKDSVKRPLRLLLLPGRANAVVRAPSAGSANDAASPAEWFLRLVTTGRDGKRAEREPRPARVFGHDLGACIQEALPTHGGEGAAATGSAVATAPLAASRAVAERPPAAASESTPQREPARPQDQQSGCASDHEAPDRWSQHMASLVEDLCSRTDPAFKSWTATLRMDPNVLPDTQLRLSLSPHWLSLRFITDSTSATNLVSTHRPELQSLLESAPNLPHGIDIDIA